MKMLKNVPWTKVFIAAILFMVVGKIIYTLEAFFTMNYYLDANYFAVWSKVMMPTVGPPPPSFHFYTVLFGFITGFLFAMVYAMVRKAIPYEGMMKGATYGVLVFLVAGIPGALSTYLLINLPTGLIVWWMFSRLLVDLIGGALTAKIVR
ncbi:MAG: hypothetical protein ACPL06_01825 [Candidatus Anstonellales archaeon]